MSEILRYFPNGLPISWNIKRIKEISKKHKAGGTPRRSVQEYWDGDIPFAVIHDITTTHLYLKQTTQKISELGLENSSAWIVPPGSVLVSMYASIGFTAINTIPLATNQAILAIIPSREALAEFIAYAISYFKDALIQQRVESTQKNVNKSIVENFPLPLPPLPEQRKIAAVLSQVQRAIEQQERLIALTAELKRAVMRKLFTEGLRGEPQKMTEIGPVPESWEVVRLGDFLTLAQYGLSVRGSESGNYPILRMTNQVNGKIIPNNLQWVEIDDDQFQKFSLRQGDILFNRTNSFELVGKTAIFDIDGDYVFASYLIRLRIDEHRLNPYFLNYFFNSDATQQRLKSIATRAVSQSNISATRLKGFPIPLPKIDEQQEIIELLEIVDNKIENRKQRRDQLQSLFRTLLHQLMTAQIRVADWNLTAMGLTLPETEVSPTT